MSNAYWDLVFARSAVDVARRALSLADRLVEDNQARVEVGTLAPLDIVQAQAEAATRRQTLAAAEATASTADLAAQALPGEWHRRSAVATGDSCRWTCPSTGAAADRRRGPRSAGPSAERTDIVTSRKNLESNDVNIRFFKNQSLPALDLTATYGAQGIGGTSFIREGSGVDAPSSARFRVATSTRLALTATARSRRGTCR